MQTYAAGYVLTYKTAVNQLISRTLTAAKVKFFVLPVHEFSLCNNTFNWIRML
jgi:hypothetical protein